MPRPDPDSPEKIAERARVAEHYRQTGNKAETARQLGIEQSKVKRMMDRYQLDVATGRVPKVLPTISATPRLPETTEAYMRQAAPRLPEPAPEAGGPVLPEPWEPTPLEPFDMQVQGWVPVLGDLHMPFHDRATIESCVREARDRRARGFLINGDGMDMAGISPFFRRFTRARFVDELELGKQFVGWLRSQLPDARIVWKQGNHEWRLIRFLAERAEELEDLPCLQLPSLLGLDAHGIEWVADKRKVMLGKLPVLHGHEFKQALSNVVSPARLAFLRGTSTVMVNHHHRTSEHHVRTLDNKDVAAWSVGCACYKAPEYDPYNQWNHGYAMVEVQADGWFSVHNRRVLNGRVV